MIRLGWIKARPLRRKTSQKSPGQIHFSGRRANLYFSSELLSTDEYIVHSHMKLD